MKIIFVNRFFHPDLAPTGLYAADVAFDLAAARLLAEEHGVMFSFTGGGFHFPRLRATGLANVSVRGYVAEARLGESLAACDIHLVTLLPAFEGLIVPSKFYAAAAAGRAVIFIGDPDGEIALARWREVIAEVEKSGSK